MKTQSLYQKAISFAGDKHSGKIVMGTRANYLMHLSNVAMEILIASDTTDHFDRDLAVQVALLHDTLEDTDTTFSELKSRFGSPVAEGVLALSKKENLPKEAQMTDSLRRIKKQQKEVWAVKLADRITNLQPPPPDWTKKRKQEYLHESKIILGELKEGNAYLAKRLEYMIEEYKNYISKMKTLYIDMDNVLVDFQSAFPKISEEIRKKYKDNEDDIPGIFALMQPMPGALESVAFLAKHFDIYILSTAPWKNPSAWSDKLLWIKEYLPEIAYKRLIISHHKHLHTGDYLIDDRTKNGAGEFTGEHVHFGEKGSYKTWREVVDYLTEKERLL